MMTLMKSSRKVVGDWLRRAMMALAAAPAHNDRKAWTEYYRFPMF
jgi:hypothetical protein